MDIALYSVNLSTFYDACGTKKDEIIEQALSFLNDKVILRDRDQRRSSLKQRLFASYLRRLVFEDRERFLALQQNKQKQDSLEDMLQPLIASYSILAILSQNFIFKDYGSLSVSYFLNVFRDLQANAQLDTDVHSAWKYLINGRELVKLNSNEGFLHTYLTNKEIKQILSSLSFYKTAPGIQHLSQLREEKESALPFGPKFFNTKEGQEYRHLYDLQRQELSEGKVEFFNSIEGQRLKILREDRDKVYQYVNLLNGIDSIRNTIVKIFKDKGDLFGIIT